MTEPLNGKYWTVPDVDKLTVEELFSSSEIRERREELKKTIGKSVDRIWKARYGDEF